MYKKISLITILFSCLSMFFVLPQFVQAVDGEITYTGTNTNLIGDDVSAGPFNLGFTFNYYGTSYTQAYVNINGTITFGSGYNAYSNCALNGCGANNTIYAFWDDLNTNSARNIYYATIGTAPNRKFVTQWTNIYFHGTSIQMGTFQIILTEGSNEIRLQYRDLLGGDRALGNSATIGIKKDSSVYEQYSNGTASLTQGQSIVYTPNGTNDYNVNTNGTYDLVYLAPEGAPTSPTLVNPTDGTTGVTLTPTFEWLPVEGASSYSVLISTVSNFSSTVVNQSGITGTSYTPGSALNQNTNYYWRVQAVNSNGSSLSPTRSFTTGSTNNAPSTPSNVVSSAFIGGTISDPVGETLTVTLADPDADEQVRYRIQISTDAAFSDLVLDYRSPFDDEGEVVYTYGQSVGTYLVGSSTTALPLDDYYLRIRAEDDAAASSAWYTASGVAFTVVEAPDEDPPVISAISVTSIATSTATVVWTTDESADSRIDYGTSVSYGQVATSSSFQTSHSISLLNLEPGTIYHYRIQSSDADSNIATSSDLTFTTENLPDETAPGISDISVDPESDSVTVYWTTDENASSLVEYGPSTTFTASTTESNTSPRVLSHEVVIPNLEACVTYHYRVISRDASLNEVVSNVNSFTTKGCVGEAVVTAQSAASVATSTGGTLDLRQSGRGLAISVPVAFASSSAHFQIKKVDDTAAVASTSVPTGVVSVGAYTYELHAVTDDFQIIEEFEEPITLTLAYGPSDVDGIEETSLMIYRWNGLNWRALSDCSVDIQAKTVTCSTDHFSTFALFGSEIEEEVERAPKKAGTSIKAQVKNLERIGNIKKAEDIKKEWSHLFETDSDKRQSSDNANDQSGFNRSLELGSIGLDVKNLQQFLNTSGFKVAESGPGSTGNETETFGPATQSALARFQAANGILPAVGYFGPVTQAFIASYSPMAPSDVPSNAPGAQPMSKPGMRDLELGMNGQDVSTLQEFLINAGYTIPAGITGYFGQQTKDALITYQKDNNITPASGYFGPKTKAISGL